MLHTSQFRRCTLPGPNVNRWPSPSTSFDIGTRPFPHPRWTAATC